MPRRVYTKWKKANLTGGLLGFALWEAVGAKAPAHLCLRTVQAGRGSPAGLVHAVRQGLAQHPDEATLPV